MDKFFEYAQFVCAIALVVCTATFIAYSIYMRSFAYLVAFTVMLVLSLVIARIAYEEIKQQK